MANSNITKDLDGQQTLNGTDKTGQSPYSMANKGGMGGTQKLPNTFVRGGLVRSND